MAEPSASDDRVDLFVTCVVEHLTPDVGMATARVLRDAGCAVGVPEGQTCCGQPAWNAGFAEEAARVARTSLDALAGDRPDDEADDPPTVVVPAGSCATMIRLYWPQLFRLVGDEDAAQRAEAVGARTRELSDALVERGYEPAAVDEAAPVAYHHSCHMLRELHVHEQPTDLLDAAGCPVADWEADDRCCGFGGTFSVKLPETSVTMADDKLDTLPEGVTEVVGADSSCLVHLQGRADHRDMAVTTRHLAEVLAEGADDADRSRG